MADITNPQAVKFANEYARCLANSAAKYYYESKLFLDEWEAAGIAAVMPNTSDVIVDGSATDGRTPITGARVNQLKGHVEAMVADMEANDNQKLNILLAIATRFRVSE